MSLSGLEDTVTLEENMHTEPNFSDHGINITWTTLFGSHEYTITKDKVLIYSHISILKQRWVVIVFCSTTITCTALVRWSFEAFFCTVQFSKEFSINGNIRKRFGSRDSNPGRRGTKPECYLCALAAPPHELSMLTFSKSELQPLALVHHLPWEFYLSVASWLNKN